jgi:hypothetical protein
VHCEQERVIVTRSLADSQQGIAGYLPAIMDKARFQTGLDFNQAASSHLPEYRARSARSTCK